MADNNDLNNELEKLKDNDLNKVSGGIFGLDDDYDDGHELSCFVSTASWNQENECPDSPDHYHYWFENKNKLYYYTCKHCGETIGKNNGLTKT